MKIKTLPILFGIVLVLVGCQPADQKASSSYFDSQETGVLSGGIKMISINTPKGTFKVWTKRIGNNPSIKLLLLHGGPGMTHEYFECMESFLPKEGIEFIYYDQLGSGNSEQPKDTSLWQVERSVDELEQVRQALGLNKDNFYLLGHSWGGIVAQEYALKHQEHLKGLIISNMMSSAPLYDKYAEEVLAPKMDPAVLKEIREIEARKEYTSPRYMELLTPHFYNKHICRLPLDQWPEPMTRSLSKVNAEIYVSMQGPSEFGLSGKLENWDVSQKIGNITVPTLVIGATHDTMDPKHMEWMSKQVKNGQYLLCPQGGHMCMWDDQQAYMKGLIAFLKK